MPVKKNTFDRLNPLLSHTSVHIALLVVMTVLCYANSLLVPFTMDDMKEISENPVVHSLTTFFSNGNGYDFNPNRFVGNMTFALNYHFSGLNVVGYHLVNLAIHIANGLLVYSLVRLTFRTPFFGPLIPQISTASVQSSTLNPQLPLLIALFTALLFVCHPIQTQAVTYIVQRLTSLAALFYLAALVLHIRWRLAREAGSPFLSRAVLPFYLLSLLSAVLAMKTKEIAFTLPMIVLLYEVSFFGTPNRRLMTIFVPLMATLLIIPFGMISLQSPLGTLLSDADKLTVIASRLSRWEYLCTQLSVIVTYLRLLVLPINQNLDHDYPVYHSLFEPRVYLSLLVLLALFSLALYLWKISFNNQPAFSTRNPQFSTICSRRLLRLASFGILWFFLTLAVESSIIPISDVIFEHRLYLPSVGFFMAAIALLATGIESRASRGDSFKRWSVLLLSFVVIALSVATMNRNRLWSNPVALWEDAVRKSPLKARPHKNLGLAYGSLGNSEMARRERQIFNTLDSKYVVNLYPASAEAHYKLANAYREQGLLAEAIQEYREAIRLKPDHAKAHSDLGLVYALQGRLIEAITEFKTATTLAPENQIIRENLHNLLKQQTQRN